MIQYLTNRFLLYTHGVSKLDLLRYRVSFRFYILHWYNTEHLNILIERKSQWIRSSWICVYCSILPSGLFLAEIGMSCILKINTSGEVYMS